MEYTQVIIPNVDSETSNIVIAFLNEAGFEGFEENENQLIAYIPQEQFDVSFLESVLHPFHLNYSIKHLAKTNWNKEWESNFQPVIVADFCTVRADFHHISVATPFEIVITPKMSFGTGHHATTQLMMKMMQFLDFKQKKVLDFGTGTGILAILASFLGADSVLAIDNDEWSVENAIENVSRNNVANVKLQLGTMEDVVLSNFDIILANINRHILLNNMDILFAKIRPGGELLMSGLLLEDKGIVLKEATKAGFQFVKEESLNSWIALLFNK